ncbi:MAG: type I restriction enzyme HsdR N-terminal domain-containing protein [Candidatus Poribacteria bacterium]|nr:type I restriction enzyme HsdR N-terminal domain-containing protein [Candidatus Poribacteria bacterium]
MTLKEHIDDIRDRLKKGEFPNEAAVCDDIVRRLVHELGWPRYQSQIVYPQYSVEGGRVDFALCHPPSKPRVFIEVKQVEKIEGAEEQLFRYAFQRGIPIAILTDGREWQFFYPTGEGTWAERKVCELDIITGESAENAEKLNRYLNYESIRTGEAVEAIKADYKVVVQQRQVAIRLPEAWSKLLEEADEFLLHAVAEKTENLCGHRPTDEQVLTFLKSLKKETELDMDRSLVSSNTVPTFLNKKPSRQSKAPAKFIVITMPNGEVIKGYSGIDTFVKVIEKLIEAYGEDTVLRAADGHAIISTSSFNYPGKRDKRLGRFYISTNHGTDQKKIYLNHIADRLGVDLKIKIVDS